MSRPSSAKEGTVSTVLASAVAAADPIELR